MAKKVIMVNDEIEGNAKYIIEESIKPLDALHLASASYESADYFCTSDKNLLKKAKQIGGLNTKIVSPIELIEEFEK